jgi:hypothetical protein
MTLGTKAWRDGKRLRRWLLGAWLKEVRIWLPGLDFAGEREILQSGARWHSAGWAACSYQANNGIHVWQWFSHLFAQETRRQIPIAEATRLLNRADPLWCAIPNVRSVTDQRRDVSGHRANGIQNYFGKPQTRLSRACFR